MNISQHFDKNNLHHGYLIEGRREEIVPEILAFCEELDIKTTSNPDFYHIEIDNFKIDEAFDVRAMSVNKSFTSSKRIFILSINNFSLDAQNVLLKMFEEPTENTHFFLVVPDTNALLKTFISRFYFISTKSDQGQEAQDAQKFMMMSQRDRIDFIKELLTEEEEEDEMGNDVVALDSARSKALKFLNALEFTLHNKMSKMPLDTACFEQIFKVREFLRMPGSSIKSLMESVALIVPHFPN